MLKTLETHWTLVTILLILAILTSLFLFPNLTQVASLLVLLFSLALTITFAIQKPIKAYGEGRIDRATLRRKIIVDATGLLLMMALALLAGRAAGAWVAGMVQQAGFAVLWVVLASLGVALGTGLGVGAIVQLVWSKITRLKRTIPAQTKAG